MTERFNTSHILLFQSARAREEAIRLADGANFEGAAASLREAMGKMSVCEAVPFIAEEMQDLHAEAMRLEAQEYQAADRKYHGARAMALRDLKADYARSVNRKKPEGETQ